MGVVSNSPSICLSSERSIQLTQVSESQIQEEGSVSESKLQPPATLSETISNNFENSKPSNNLQDIDQEASSNTSEVPLKTSQGHSVVVGSESISTLSECTTRCDVKQSKQDVTHANPVGSSEPNDDSRKHAGMSSDGIHSVEWIGNAFKVEDGKTFYESCLVDGVTY
ncbi:hypothetical protein P3X46_006579 [Hevea brasiliensis]|uniref:Uncharacterized protein n=1 Tax=Hevea brasiliensis TaxID=3981 RepID=A0ABQ9MQN3_HEVBR|nr:hypothetical protein P3X46_006579 [Hevea brasiliensis]